MAHTAQIVGRIAAVLAAAEAFGRLAEPVGPPAILGEFGAGGVLGLSVSGLVDPQDDRPHTLAEFGVILLPFEIRLGIGRWRRSRVGGAVAAVALVGVVLPFAPGDSDCRLLGPAQRVAGGAGAALAATSAGITARVLTDLGRLNDPDSQAILGAAALDAVIGLVFLPVVANLIPAGQGVTAGGVAKSTGVAFDFLAATLAVGRFAGPPLVRLAARVDLPGTPTMVAVVLALPLARLASAAGSAMIAGAFAAGLLVRGTRGGGRSRARGLAPRPLLRADLLCCGRGFGGRPRPRSLRPGPSDDARRRRPPRRRGRRQVPGWLRPVPVPGGKGVDRRRHDPPRRGGSHVRAAGARDRGVRPGLFGAAMRVAMVTTVIAPPLLKLLSPPVAGGGPSGRPGGVEDLCTEALPSIRRSLFRCSRVSG